jgi:threonine/homoserine/homoserine lactone efflux protein
MTGRLVAFVGFAVVAAASPGPSNVLLAATGASVGVLRGLPCLLGVGAGMASMMFVVAFGLGRAILDHPLVLEGVRWGGAAVLCWLAWRIATARRGAATAGARPAGFLGAAVFQWVNPKAWLVCASAAATFLDARAGSAVGQSAALALAFLLACLPSCFPWLAFGAVLQRRLRSERAFRALSWGMGALLAASVVFIL